MGIRDDAGVRLYINPRVDRGPLGRLVPYDGSAAGLRCPSQRGASMMRQSAKPLMGPCCPRHIWATFGKTICSV
jgi:hypothetical protein